MIDYNTLVIFTANFVSQNIGQPINVDAYKKYHCCTLFIGCSQNLYSIQQYCPINTVFLCIPFIVMPVARFKTKSRQLRNGHVS